MSLARFDPSIVTVHSPVSLFKLSVVQLFSRSWFCLSPSITRLHGAVTVDFDSVAFFLS